jgi:hypothetical protein
MRQAVDNLQFTLGCLAASKGESALSAPHLIVHVGKLRKLAWYTVYSVRRRRQ